MKVQVLGAGCAKCKALKANAASALREMSVDGDVENVEDIQEIIRYGVMMTPALVVDGRVMVEGRVPSAGEIKTMLQR